MENKQEDLDAVLDAALKVYVGREPPSGMEGRILRYARHTPPFRLPLLAWVIGAAALAAVCLLSIVPRQVPPKPSVAVVSPPQVKPVANPPGPVPAAVAVRRTPVKRDLAEERHRAMLQFVRMNPETARELLAGLNEEVKPIVIDALEISPLRIAELKTEEQTNEDNDDNPGSAAVDRPRIFADR